jgi:hypothetical protein
MLPPATTATRGAAEPQDGPTAILPRLNPASGTNHRPRRTQGGDRSKTRRRDQPDALAAASQPWPGGDTRATLKRHPRRRPYVRWVLRRKAGRPETDLRPSPTCGISRPRLRPAAILLSAPGATTSRHVRDRACRYASAQFRSHRRSSRKSDAATIAIGSERARRDEPPA